MTKFKLNEQQQEAVEKKDGAYSIIAAAGSGKTAILLERTKNLVKKHNVLENQILLVTFTRNTADDMINRLKDEGLSHVNVGTFHSIAGQILRKEGVDINGSNMVQEWQIDNVFKAIDQKADSTDIMNWISFQKNRMKGVDDEFDKKSSEYSEDQLRVYYKAYENFKNRQGLYDFDDYLLLCLEVVKNNPGLYTYDYILVDEHQDSNKIQNLLLEHWSASGNVFVVGDFRQCFPPKTKIKQSGNTYKNIEDISRGDKIVVASGRGTASKSIVSDTLKRYYSGKVVSLKTESGKSIKATPNHTVFIDTFINEHSYFVYLMYREDKGFRIGRSSQHNIVKNGKREYRNGYEKRLVDEKGDKVWVLGVYDKVEESIFYEQYYSVKYGLPLYVFKNNHTRGLLSQEMIDKLYNSINTLGKGMKVIEDFALFFDEPHYIPYGDSRFKTRNRINFTMFGSSRFSSGIKYPYKGYSHELSTSTVNEKYAQKVAKTFGSSLSKKTNSNKLKYYNPRKISNDHDDLVNRAEQVARLDENTRIVKRANLTKDLKQKFYMMPISNVCKGMRIPIYKDGKIMSERVIEVSHEDYEGYVYDLNVDMYRNYIANDIAVHNCVYGFRSSSAEYIMHMDKYWKGAETLNVHINYRSPKNIVDNANQFIKQYYSDYEYYVDSEANNKTDGHIEISSHPNREVESVEVVNKIQKLINNEVELKDIAVLYRNNKHADFVENELKRREIDYEIANDGSFFKRREIAGILSFLRLLLDTDDDSAFEGAFRLRTHPLKYFSNNVYSDIQNYANREGLSLFKAMQSNSYPKTWHMKNVIAFRNGISRIRRMVEFSMVGDIIEEIVNTFKIRELVREKYNHKPERDERLGSIEVLKSFVGNNDLEEFIAYVYSGNTDKRKKKDNAVQLMTIHRSKGLEWDNVFLAGVEDGEFPSGREGVDIVEEARLMYVGVTRSKKNLWINEIGGNNTFVQEYGYDNENIIVE